MEERSVVLRLKKKPDSSGQNIEGFTRSYLITCVLDARNQGFDQADDLRFLKLIRICFWVRRKRFTMVYEFVFFVIFGLFV